MKIKKLSIQHFLQLIKSTLHEITDQQNPQKNGQYNTTIYTLFNKKHKITPPESVDISLNNLCS